MVKKISAYSPFYPTTVGTISHDVTLQQLPAYSMRQKTELKTKCCKKLNVSTLHRTNFLYSSTDSPGPGAYPKDDVKKGNQIPKSIYPQDKAFKYSLGVKGYGFD